MNILIKLTCLIGLVMAPVLGHQAEINISQNDTKVNNKIEVVLDESTNNLDIQK